MKQRENRDTMTVEFDVKLEPKDLYRFNLYQTYTGSQGIISILIIILAGVMTGVSFADGSYNYAFLYAVFFVIFLGYIPVTLWTRAKLSLKTNAVLAGMLHYEISEEAIRVTQGEESGELPWDQIYKMIATKHNVLIYSGRKNAYIIPRTQLGTKYEALSKIANSRLEKFRVKM